MKAIKKSSTLKPADCPDTEIMFIFGKTTKNIPMAAMALYITGLNLKTTLDLVCIKISKLIQNIP